MSQPGLSFTEAYTAVLLARSSCLSDPMIYMSSTSITVPAGVTRAYVHVWGAGGGGVVANGPTSSARGAAGEVPAPQVRIAADTLDAQQKNGTG